ncbi:hypothetical protein BB934_37865 (plasmid) [Microvirga ossetica]|uniref:Insecticide toxin TcdB middle/N-terminal domain-containing protein n=1 Tax=Microvirga ossetica TaxID=1882682 RepID=A0A1B2EVS5_9HYPH|nr:HYD1 signature containing ADP-ribosyltransferase family protein [Microvirga ossetica]ANY84032.1 hypothetical protein BB934_37865 [Microvirga ossetica]
MAEKAGLSLVLSRGTVLLLRVAVLFGFSSELALAELPAPPQAISGTFGESTSTPSIEQATGVLTYTVPFSLPAARGDVQPGLGLHYRSTSGTGEAGESWSIGLPAIERAPLSGWPIYADAGNPRSEDRFAYAGSPLTFVCTVGGDPACPAAAGPMPSWAQGFRHYRRQVDRGGERLFLSGDRKTWIVQHKGGQIFELGSPLTRPDLTTDGIDREGGPPFSMFRWNLVRQYDLHGIEAGSLGGGKNLIVYGWGGNSSRKYLYNVYYTPPANNWGSSHSDFAYHVQLWWDWPPYFRRDYTEMDKRRHWLRLRRVAVAAKNSAGTGEREVVRAYNLTYYADRSVPATSDQAPLWGRSYLKQVQLEGRCGVKELNGSIPEITNCPTLPPQSFEYENAWIALGKAERSPLEATPAAGNEGLKYVANSAVLDVNRDGFPDIVQGWPQNHQIAVWPDGGIAWWHPECPEPNDSNARVDVWFHVASTPAGPQLICHYASDPTPVTIRSAREHIAYINRGPTSLGPVRLQHHCLDAGDGASGTLTHWQTLPPSGHSHVALFSQWGAEAVGPWGDALFLWTKANLHGFGIEATPAEESFCPNARPSDGNLKYPSLKWVETPDTFWAKRPTDLQPPPTSGIYVDIDGDGLVDRLSVEPEQANGFQKATVLLSRRVPHLHVEDGIEGPALIPFTRAPEASPAAFRGGATSYYADVSGDGVVDLVTIEGFDPVPIVRPGNGRGHFGCRSEDSICSVAGNGSWLGRGYRIFVPDADLPWPVSEYDISAGWKRKGFFHDVTGEGFADLVVYQPDEIGSDGFRRGFIRLWVNVDGRTFRCANPSDACKVGVVVDPDRPTALEVDARVVFADIDANGTDEFVLLGIKGAWHFSFVTKTPMGSWGPRAPRPGLLTRIRNGVGADTEIAYQTIQEHDRNAWYSDPDADSFLQVWRSHSPAVLPVVSRITQRDTPAALGTPLVDPYRFDRTTKYSYRDPAYDPWERAFKGFRRVRATSETGEVIQTWHWFGDCESGKVSPNCTRTSDVSDNAALVGVPVRVDRFVPSDGETPTKWLSTTTMVYTSAGSFDVPAANFPPPAADRSVRRSQVFELHQFLYDTETGVSVANADQHPFARQPVPDQPGKRQHLVTQMSYDADGNMTAVVRRGRELATGTTNEYPDPQITTRSTPPSGRCGADWGCRASGMIMEEQRQGMSLPETLRRRSFTYNVAGDLISVRAQLSYPYRVFGQAWLDRNLALGTGPPASASMAPGERTLVSIDVSEHGVPVRITGAPSLPSDSRLLASATLDQPYAQFIETLTRFSAGPGGGPLATKFGFDRGLGQITYTSDPSGASQTRVYDSFGRLAEVHLPRRDGSFGATELALRLSHHEKSPLSFVRIERWIDTDHFIASYEIFNGLGEHILGYDQADVDADGSPWIQRDWTERDSAGRINTQVRPKSFFGDPFTVADTAPPLSAMFGRMWTEYDDFGRPLERYSDQTLLARFAYRPLEVEARDAEQVITGGPHGNAFAKIAFDGHGRVAETSSTGNGDVIIAEADYLGTGEPRSLKRRHANGSDTYTRTLQWDSFGRLVENDEPNTARTEGSTRRNWKYVYDDAGRLVGTSDARGCGSNLYYDGLSRLIAEDYSPCEASHAPYTAPNLATGTGTEAFFRYDDYEPGQIAPSPSFNDRAELALGRLASIQDRGSHTRLNYDARGAPRLITRRIAKPGSPAAELANRYATPWFSQSFQFDRGNRLRARETTPSLDFKETFDYSERGLLRTIGSSDGLLISELSYLPNGAVDYYYYGDAARTRVALSYDARDRLTNYRVNRHNAIPVWLSGLPPTYSKPDPETTQLDLLHHRFVYGASSNPLKIDDLSSGLWPDGAKQVSRAASYDDAYRLTSIHHDHGNDKQVLAFDAEMNAGSNRPVPEGPGQERVIEQMFRFDWLGNSIETLDDATRHYDRSLGEITNGAALLTGAVEGPHQIRSADGVAASYDAAGNMRELIVSRESCLSKSQKCSHRFRYNFDEVGQLTRAGRWDYSAGAVPPHDANVPPDWTLSYRYSEGARVLRTTKDRAGEEKYSLDVFDTLRIDRADYHVPSGSYDFAIDNEIRFTAGNGRVFRDRDLVLPLARQDGRKIHTFLSIPDYLGSTAFVIDKDSGEVVERATYQAFGAPDVDYRPERWASSREDFKFTGKEEDIEVGLIYFGLRYYQPRIGRWVSADPLTIHSLAGDSNPYAYVSGRVMTHVDAFGLQGQPPGPPPPIPGTHWNDATSVETSCNPCVSDDRMVRLENAASMRAEMQASRQITAKNVFLGTAQIPIPGTKNAYFTQGGVQTAVHNALTGMLINAALPPGIGLLLRGMGVNLSKPFILPVGNDENDKSTLVGTGAVVIASVVAGRAPAAVGEGGAIGRQVLYHYTSEAGMTGIIERNSLNPSLWRVGTNDVRYGNGQYVSDIVPGTRTPGELSRDFLGFPFQESRFTHYVEIDATGLGAVQGRAGVYVIPNEVPLDLTGRLLSSGRVPGR